MPNLRPYDAVDYATKLVGNMDVDRLLPRLLDDVHKMFWMYANWRWSLGLLTPVTVTANTQDYAVTLPADFLYLVDVLQVDGKTTRHIKPTAIYPATGLLRGGQISNVAVQTVNAQTVLRVDPTPGDIPASPTQHLVGVYKQLAPTIDLSTMYNSGALLIPDEYFWVFQEGVTWKALEWAQDPRAGEVKFQQGQAIYSGARAAFEAALQTCASQEKLYTPDPQEAQR